MLRLGPEPIDAAALLSAFEESISASGGIVTFSGQVRPETDAGSVKSLFLQSYSPMTENGIKDAVADANRRWPLEACWVAHRTGQILPGETIVFVATASRHRRAAFEAADFVMDYLKTEAVFWKKEETATGQKWIEPRGQDYQDAARWTEKDNV